MRFEHERDGETGASGESATLRTGHAAIHEAAGRLFDAETARVVRERAATLIADYLGHRAVAFYRVDGDRAEAIHRTEAFTELYDTPVFEPLPGTLRTVVEMGVPRSETERVPFEAAAAYCAAPTGHGEVVVCPFSTASCLGERFREHLNETASLAGTALFRAVADAVDTADAADADHTADAADTDEPGDAADTDEPGDAADTDEPGDAADTDEPGDAADTADTAGTADADDTDEPGDTDETADTGGSDRPGRESVLDALDRSFPDYAFLYDREGTYVDLLLGRRNVGEHNREQLVGSTVYEVLTTDAADRVTAAIRESIDEQETVSVEYPVETGGQIRHYEGMVSPLEFDGQETAVLVARDVTELRRRREQLRRRNERLEAFTSIVCHDLKNPLNTAQGYLELLEAQLSDPPEEMGAVARALERMEEISQGVLALAHHERADLDLAPVDAESVTADCWELTTTADATLEVESFQLVADETSLRHVFENLFGNSLTHGGPETTVRVGPTDDGFYVADDGPGIPPEHRELVFETGASFGDEGSGIGLVVVETVADAHDWTVSVTASWAGGARFEFSGVTRPDTDADDDPFA